MEGPGPAPAGWSPLTGIVGLRWSNWSQTPEHTQECGGAAVRCTAHIWCHVLLLLSVLGSSPEALSEG